MYPDTQRKQKFPLWRAYTESSGFTELIRRTCVDARSIRIKKFADTKISGYAWTGPFSPHYSSFLAMFYDLRDAQCVGYKNNKILTFPLSFAQ